MTIASVAGCTTLEGAMVDQAALYGLIAKARNLGLTSIAVLPVTGWNEGMGREDPPDPCDWARLASP